MSWANRNPRTLLRAVSGIILLVGLTSSVVIYYNADDCPGSPQCAENEYDNPVSPENSKKNLRGMELYGGESGVLVYQLEHWFLGLWHGKTLAYTVYSITIILAFAAYFAASRVQPATKDGRDDSARSKDA
jgi:hypothetical protein